MPPQIVRAMWEEVDELSKLETEKIKSYWESMCGGFMVRPSWSFE